MQCIAYRRCCACGELSITRGRRFLGGWFFIRCPNCKSLMRVVASLAIAFAVTRF
jgi:hypothetical protein